MFVRGAEREGKEAQRVKKGEREKRKQNNTRWIQQIYCRNRKLFMIAMSWFVVCVCRASAAALQCQCEWVPRLRTQANTSKSAKNSFETVITDACYVYCFVSLLLYGRMPVSRCSVCVCVCVCLGAYLPSYIVGCVWSVNAHRMSYG